MNQLLLVLLVWLAVSGAKAMPARRDASSPDQCHEGVVRLTYSLSTQFSKSSPVACDYNYIAGTCKPVTGVKFSANGKLWQVHLEYTKDELTLKAEGYGTITKIRQAMEDIFPLKNSITIASDGVVFTGSLSCRCGYETVMDDKVGLYCRLPKASLTKMVSPAPKVENTIIKYFPLECREECQQENKCVLATYDYVKKECHFYSKDGFAAQYQMEDAKGDVVVFAGSSLPIMEGFSIKMAEGMRKQNAPTFLGYAKNEAHETGTFLALASMAYTKKKEKTFLYAPSSALDPFATVASIKSSVLGLSSANGTKQLPVLDGPSTIHLLMAGKEALSTLDRTIISTQASQDVARLGTELTNIMKNEVNIKLQHGNFDFRFLVAEHARLEGIINKVMTSIQSFSENIEKIAFEAQGDDMIQFTFETVFVVAKAASSSAGLANPFATGASDVDKIIQNWRDVQLQAQKLAKMVAAGADMEDAIKTLTEAYTVARSRINSLKSTAGMAKDFIASFKDGSFKKSLTEADIQSFLDAYSKYKAPFSATQVREANIKLSKGFDVMCEQIIEKGFTVVDAGIFQRKCTQMTADLANILSLQTTIGSAGLSLVEKTAAIFSKYLLVSNNQALADSIQKTINAQMAKGAKMAILTVSAQVKSATLRMQYTQHLIQLCTLAEYYSGGATKSMCNQIRLATDVLSVDQIFTKLKSLLGDTSIPSSDMTLCGYLPSFPDENGSMEHSLSLDSIARQSESPFRLSNSDKWLRTYGWDQIANGLAHGNNYFVSRVQLPMPYADVSAGATTGLFASVYAMNEYRVVSDKTHLKSFDAGGSNAKYAFQYADAGRVVCHSETVRNFMEPCTHKNAQRVLNDICIQQRGDIQNYLPFSTTPVLPALFSSFKVHVTQGAVSFKPFAKQTIRDDKGKVILHANKMLAPICLHLKVAVQIQPYYSTIAQFPAPQATCSACPKGKFHQDPLQNRYQCKDCPEGTHQDHDGRFTCVLCPIGEYQNEKGQSKCKKCSSNSCCPVEGLVNPLSNC
eukprot:Nk52_evm5s346 gene=Nk52_evmTU5s346